MPNWCHNVLTVTGPEEALGRFHDAHTKRGDDGETVFTFEGSLPRPKALRGIQSGSCTIDGERVKNWVVRDGKNVAIQERTLAFLTARYGATNLYDWSVKHWGTKWDAGESGFEASPGGRLYTFETAWGPPGEWAQKASELFPELRLTIEYEEPGMCFAGTYVAAGGAVLCDESHDYEPQHEEEVE